MATDRFGNTIAVGDVVIPGGKIRVVDATNSRVVATIGDAPHVINNTEAVLADWTDRRWWPLTLKCVDGGSALTAVECTHDAELTSSYQIPIFGDCKWIGGAVYAAHVNGSDPGDWTVDCFVNGSGTSSKSLTFGWSASSYPSQLVTTVKFATPLSLSDGDRVRFRIAGPSINVVVVKIVVMMQSDAVLSE